MVALARLGVCDWAFTVGLVCLGRSGWAGVVGHMWMDGLMRSGMRIGLGDWVIGIVWLGRCGCACAVGLVRLGRGGWSCVVGCMWLCLCTWAFAIGHMWLGWGG